MDAFPINGKSKLQPERLIYTFAAMSSRFVTFLLMILFLGRIVGYFPVFKIEQYRIRREIKNKLKGAIPNSELQVFSYPAGSKDAIKYGGMHEFEIEGEMYDVVRKETKGTSLILYCFHDKKESKLFDRLDTRVKDGMNTADHPFRHVINIFGKTFHSLEPLMDLLKFHGTSDLNSLLFGYSNAYNFLFARKFVPPPQFRF